MTNRETDEATGVETTGHEWDGIKELERIWIIPVHSRMQ